jgi:hypothetical protein
MSHHTLDDKFLSRKSGSFASRAALMARSVLLLLAGFATATPSLHAQTTAQIQAAQTAIEKYIPAGQTIVTTSSSALGAAVAAVLRTNTNTALLPYYFAESALLPYPYPTGTVRAEPNRDAAAAVVTGSAIWQIAATGTTAKVTLADFYADVANITDSVIDVSGANTAKDLTLQGRIGVLKSALAEITARYGVTPYATYKANLLGSDTVLGEKLLADTFLEGLANKGLTTLLEDAMPGVTGTNVALAPTLANAFVAGLITTSSNTFSWPDKAQGATSSTFAVSILATIAGNATTDELVSHTIGTKIYANATANLGSLALFGEALFAAYPNVEAKVTQGIAAAITPAAENENTRYNLAYILAKANPANVVGIDEGMTYVDPFYAGGAAGFTAGCFSGILATGASGTSTLAAFAPKIASGVGSVLGQDGNSLTQVASIFSTYVGQGTLSASNAGVYTVDLITGAETSTVLASQFTGKAAGAGGGKLNLTTPVTATVLDLASITDVMADGIIKYYGTKINTTDASIAAAEIGALAEDVAKFVGNEAFTDSQNPKDSGSVGVFIAATLDDYIVALKLDGGSTAATSPQTLALNDIAVDVKKVVTNSTYDTEITNQETDAKNKDSVFAAITGPIAVQETTVTNL